MTCLFVPLWLMCVRFLSTTALSGRQVVLYPLSYFCKACVLSSLIKRILYCIVSLQRDIKTIEKVQRRFTKRLIGMRCLACDERLRQPCLLRLELRRLHLDLIFCYKIVFGFVSLKLIFFLSLLIPKLPEDMNTNNSSQAAPAISVLTVLVSVSLIYR